MMFGHSPILEAIPYASLASEPEANTCEDAPKARKKRGRNRRASAEPNALTVALEPNISLHVSRKRRRCIWDEGGTIDVAAHLAPGQRPMGLASADAHDAGPDGVGATDASMWHSLRQCISTFADPAFATGLGCMLASSVGTGLAKSGYLMMLKGAGHEPLLINAVMDCLQDFAAVPAMFVAHYFIDREAASREVKPDVPQRYMRGLVGCGAVELALGLGLGAAALARSEDRIGPHLLLGAVAVGQTLGTLKSLMDFGYWRCVKLHVGQARTRELQNRLQMQMVAVETPFFLLVWHAISIGVYSTALSRYANHLMGVGAAALGAGGLLAFLPRTYFAWQARNLDKAAARDVGLTEALLA